MTTTATIDQLRPGHEYPGGGINSRKDYTSQQINDRLQSILVFGVLQSLCVCPAPGKTDPPFYVAAGGLRLAAIQLGIKTKKLAADFAIPVTIRTDWDSAMALAASLEENEQVLSPHPARVYETFAELVNRGKTPDDLIKLFPQLDAKEIRRILALGQLSPVIREAWLDEEIDADAAKAFTRAKDHKHQEDVFKRLKKQGQLQDWHIRDVLSGNERDGEKFLKFVGRKAYEDAGGKIHEDLFAQGRDEKLLVMDFPLLVRLVGEKIEAKCKELIEAGWSWAVDVDDLPSGAKFGWNKIANPSANAPKDMKAKAGCAVAVSYDGKLDIIYGLLKPGVHVGKIGSTKAGKTVSAPSNKLSNSLKQRMESWAARATQDALISNTYGDEVAVTLAKIVAALIQPERLTYTSNTILSKRDAIRDGLTPKVMNEALGKRFDRQNYFSSAPKGIVVKAILESVPGAEARKLNAGTKSAAWKFAIANVPKTWLPPELRTSHYDGPGAKKATVTTLKSKAKAKKAAAPKRKAA